MRDYAGIARKITWTLFLSQSIFSAGLITMSTVNAIAGADLSGVTAWAGVPSMVLLLATAVGAFGWGLVMERSGRRPGLAIGLAFGAIGAVLAGVAILRESFLAFLGGLAMIGMSQAAMQLGRFAAAEVNPPAKRGRAIANVVVGGTIGSILGPLLVGPAGKFATGLGANELAGPYGSGFILFGFAVLVILLGLKPEPMEIARELTQNEGPLIGAEKSQQRYSLILRRPGVLVATVVMVVGQMVMVMLMVITSLHMKNHGHTLTDISLVISSHTFGMFAFSIFSGRLVDRIGREPVILVGAATLVVASLSARLSPEVIPLAVALFLLGLGWNFCYVGGSTLLADRLSTDEQARMQGLNDLFVGLASALSSLGSGFVFAGLGYQAMGIVGAGVAVIPFALTLWWMQARRRLTVAAEGEQIQ
jgi:MFS family permease